MRVASSCRLHGRVGKPLVTGGTMPDTPGRTDVQPEPADWERAPLQPFAHVDDTTDGFTELRVHGVSGPPPQHVLDYPAEMVTLVQGNAESGFWRRWRLGGNLEDTPAEHRIEAFCWGGLT